MGLRFCMLTTFYPPHNFGGDGIAIQRLSRALARRGHEVTVVHDVDAFNALHRGHEPIGEPETEGVSVVRLRSALGSFGPLLTQQTGRPVVHRARIRRILREGRFDVTMFHNTSLVGGPGLLREGVGVRLYEAHEHWLVCPTHVLWRHGREVCTGRECVRCVLRHRRPPQVWRFTGMLERELGHVDAFIAKSVFSCDKHREFGFPRDMTVIPYFLPEARGGGNGGGRAGEWVQRDHGNGGIASLSASSPDSGGAGDPRGAGAWLRPASKPRRGRPFKYSWLT
ncbi:MAG: glycosyltransferase, partial [Gemmatimonadetes bacterium]|nr:glycosyltransferase [Gemmatimonadota bacterium]